MTEIVHARLDERVRGLFERLRRQTGWKDSEIVRQGIEALARRTLTPAPKPVVGLGEFESDVDDLGSNPAHLDGFGRS